jgi:hypothetical protein
MHIKHAFDNDKVIFWFQGQENLKWKADFGLLEIVNETFLLIFSNKVLIFSVNLQWFEF